MITSAMDPHPAVTDQPKSFWDVSDPNDSSLWRNPAVHPYRPDWFAHATDAAPAGSLACSIAYAHPLCALALLRKDYVRMAAAIEPALYFSGDCTSRFLGWARQNHVVPREDPKFYHQILIESGHWGYEYAKVNDEVRLAGQVGEWCADHRHDSAAAAAVFLVRHPREPIEPHHERLRVEPATSYWALPQLYSRGFRLGAGDTQDPKWAYHLALSKFSGQNGNYLPALSRDPVWLVGYLLARDGKIESKVARETQAQLRAEHPNHPLLPRCLAVLDRQPLPATPPVLVSGQQAELSALERLRRQKNRQVYRPSDEQMNSPEFKKIVGPAQYTERGYARGTVMDVADGEFAEIKSGASVLEPTYQLRLQAYRAAVEQRPLCIYTNRPVSAQFTERITSLGVAIEPLPE